MSMTRKLCFIGGGSYLWTPRLLRDLYEHPELTFEEVALLDLHLEPATLVKRFGERLNREFKRSVRYTATTDLTSAIAGSQAILITISTGGLEAMAKDIAIPERYGVYHTVGDTAGPGGWARSLRNIPVFAQLGKQIARYAPEAFVINYTNPMAVCTDVLARFCKNKSRVVGLCHAAFELQDAIQEILHLKNRDEVELMTAGTNHFFWVMDFYVKGKSCYKKLRQTLARKPLYCKMPKADPMGFHSQRYLAQYLYECTGYLPYTGDRHTSEFVSGCINPNKNALQRWKLRRTSVGARRDMYLHARKRIERMIDGKELLPKPSGEKAAQILCSIQTGKPFRHIFNLPNRGQIENLPRNAALETSGRITKNGFIADHVGAMPQVLVNLSLPHIQMQLDLVEGFMCEDRNRIATSLLGNPLLGHLDLAQQKQLTQELWKANNSWLPSWLKA